MLFPFLECAAPVSVYTSRTKFSVMKERISQFNSMTREGILKNIWTTVGVCSTEEVRHAGCSAHEAAGVFFFAQYKCCSHTPLNNAILKAGTFSHLLVE